MRRLLSLIIILTVLWCGWWWIASSTITRVISAQIEQLRIQGWQIDAPVPATNGFPFDLRQTYASLQLTSPDNITVEIPALTLNAKAYWPGHATVSVANTPVSMTQSGTPVLFIQFTDAKATLRLRPGPAFELQDVSLQSGPWQINAPTGNLLSANDLLTTLTQITSARATYSFTVQATDLSPGDLIRSTLQTPPDAPLAFDAYTANGAVQFDKALDRHLLNGHMPRPIQFALNKAEITWGTLNLSSTADMTIDATGTPDGTITAKVQNWQKLLEYAERAGAITAGQRGQSKLMLGIFANMSGTPDDIELTVRAANGQLNINGIGLGPVPKLFR
jgi:hypothetical protein